jgi:predicted dehydrogenase
VGTDLAQDPNVDLVVCSVRVDKHFAAVAPVVKAGKNVYVEWPLGKNLEEAEELLRLSKAYGVQHTVVGLQARFAPSVAKLKELLAEGRIGRVLSSTWVGYGGNGGPTEPESIRYMVDKSIGGNLVTIHFGHAVDFVNFEQAEQINMRVIDLIDDDDNAIWDVGSAHNLIPWCSALGTDQG